MDETNPRLLVCDLDAMQFGPRLNEAKRSCLPSGFDRPVTIEQFVGAIVAVRDRVDCLDYFFCQVDPNLYATSALC